MSFASDSRGTVTNLWPAMARHGSGRPTGDPEKLRNAAEKLSDLVSPALADYLLTDETDPGNPPLVDGGAVQQDRLVKRFMLAQHSRWAMAIAGAGIDVVFIKGFANAHTLYREPSVRIQGDLDVLVRPVDFARLAEFLQAQGFSCGDPDNSPWGMISDSSFLPFVSADGASHIDIHIHPDSYPVHRSLSTERVFVASRQVAAGDGSIRVPDDSHCLILCATNAAKDKFNISSLGKVIDAMLLLDCGRPLDWDRIAGLAGDGGFRLPLRAFLALLKALGASMDGVPPDLYRPFSGLRGRALRQVLDDYRGYFPEELPMTALLWRELTLCAEPKAILHNIGLRLRGLVRPRTGSPENSPGTAGLSLTDCSNTGT